MRSLRKKWCRRYRLTVSFCVIYVISPLKMCSVSYLFDHAPFPRRDVLLFAFFSCLTSDFASLSRRSTVSTALNLLMVHRLTFSWHAVGTAVTCRGMPWAMTGDAVGSVTACHDMPRRATTHHGTTAAARPTVRIAKTLAARHGKGRGNHGTLQRATTRPKANSGAGQVPRQNPRRVPRQNPRRVPRRNPRRVPRQDPTR